MKPEIKAILKINNLEKKIAKVKEKLKPELIKGMTLKEYHHQYHLAHYDKEKYRKYYLKKKNKVKNEKFKEVYGRFPSPRELKQFLDNYYAPKKKTKLQFKEKVAN